MRTEKKFSFTQKFFNTDYPSLRDIFLKNKGKNFHAFSGK